MPVSEDPINTSAVLARPNTNLASSRPDINQVITNQPDLNLSVLSAQERARKNSERIAAKKAQIEARRAFELSMLRRPILPGERIDAPSVAVVIPVGPIEKKKPNVLLLVGVAVVGLLVIRKVLN
jgi:hypothetical protein